ncbi:MAG TPA: ZIP family metal transporter [Tissierellaceae bacterium]|nr:ZIP family metal transporter [Tissierellaceae bacterium]
MVWIITLYGLIVGMVGTGLGGLISLFVKNTHRRSSFLLGLTGGFMMFIVTFHLLPESFLLGNIYSTLTGIFIGILLIIFVEVALKKKMENTYTKTGLLLGISIAVHNFPEGLALGSSFLTLSDLGPTLAIAMLLHNIPEGISVAMPLKLNRLSPWKVVLYTILTGLPTGIGTFVGFTVGNISSKFISLCLSFAGGTMLYIICDEIIPNAKAIHKGRASSIGIILGFSLGIILYF